MTMRKTISILLLMAASFWTHPADVITTTIAITNAPIGNTNTLTISGSTRTWTNDVSTSPATLIQETNSIAYSATNLANHLTSYKPSTIFFLTQTASSNVVFKSLPGVVPSVTSAGGWASITFATNSADVPVFDVVMPITSQSATNQTNIASMIAYALSLASNAIPYHATVLNQTAGLTNNNAFTGTNSLVRGGWNNANITNALAISGVISAISNGLWNAGILISPTMTNGQNFGDAFVSSGTGTPSSQFGSGATATGDETFAAGFVAVASGFADTAVGSGASATGGSGFAAGASAGTSATNTVAVGTASSAAAPGSTAIGAFVNVAANHTNSIGIGADTTKTNQVLLGSSTHLVEVPGRFLVSGTITNATHTGNQSFGVSGGPYSTISISRYDNGSLANGDNLVDINGSSYVKVSGPSAAFAICNVTNGAPAGVVNGMRVIFQNNTTHTMTVKDASGTTVGVAANRILTGTGADIAITNTPGFVELIYDSGGSRWGVLSHSD